ncbi:MAG: tRNA (N6-isopentenyl adenosine(37)-C2)-methylthiotransferase MiaB [Rickettsiales bacterium]
MTKKVHIKTYGCQMNVYDSVRMGDVLAPLGYEESATYADADLVILNTCHIREKAAEKVYSELGRIRAEKERMEAEGKRMKIAVAGCVAQAEGEEILHRAPYVDMVIGSQSYHHLPRMLHESDKKQGVVELDFPEVQKFDLLPENFRSQGAAAFVSVQEGCDKFCTFCVVPYTRGAEYSRPVADIVREVRTLVDEKGAVEVTLLGQNVNAYHGVDEKGREVTLGKLFHILAKIPGLKRLRYMTSHPNDMRDDLIHAHGEIEMLMPYLHLPVQSGSDSILKKMNRKHTSAHYLEIIEKLRAVQPDMAFSSDFIVGFPGETEADFHDTMRLVESVSYAQAYSFMYSPRPGTPAAEREDQVPQAEKESRLQLLQELLIRQQTSFNRSKIGIEMDVLLGRPGKLEGQLIGKSPWMQSVHATDAAHLDGQMVRVKIVDAFQNSLKGELVDSKYYATSRRITVQPPTQAA